MGFILCLINKRKDKQELAKLLGEIVFDTEIKIEFSSKIDKFIYFFKMILALFVCVLLFIGGGFYFAVIQSNPFGLLAVFLFSYIVFGTSSILPKIITLNQLKGEINDMNTLGTILYLKGGTQKVMIIGRNAILKLNDEEYLYDYVGCRYPSGFSMKGMIYFNEENIDSILF